VTGAPLRGANLPAMTQVIGIVNVTPDSFSDGGRWAEPDAAIEHASELVRAGADIIDIGGESTRPGAMPVTVDEEIRRVVPVVDGIVRRFPHVPVSVDTSKAEVARRALDAGAAIVNDVTALRGDPAMADLLQTRPAVRVVLMHMQGTPATMQHRPVYRDVVSDIRDFFAERIAFCRSRGVGPERIILDPGIGFGKTTAHNLAILRRVDDFREYDGVRYPVLVGLSRKSFIGRILGSEDDPLPVHQREAGTLALHAYCIQRNVDFLRVHDVRAAVHAVRVLAAVRAA
jgi:dihydropteroate synthase